MRTLLMYGPGGRKPGRSEAMAQARFVALFTPARRPGCNGQMETEREAPLLARCLEPAGGRASPAARPGRSWRAWVALAALMLAPVQALAFLPPEVIEAAYAVAAFKSTPKQEALVFLHNKELNLMAIRGQIPPEVYQRNQHLFETVNKGFVKDAAKQAGLVAKTQAPKPGSTDTFNPGTDTDIIVESGPSGEKITADKIEATEKAYQDKVKDYLKNSGVEPPAGKVNTDTDFMPHPDSTTPEEFTKINKGINERGGTAYESPNAAKVEAKMRPPPGEPIPPLDINDTGAYVTEMQDLANHKIEKASNLETEANGLRTSNPAKADALEAEAQLLRSQASKYIDRIDKVTGEVCKQNGIEPPAKPKDSLTQASESIGKTRGTSSKTGADVIGDMGNLAVNRGVKDYSETLSKLAAKDPSQAAAAQKQIAEQLKHMNPEMREQVIKKAQTAYEKAGGTDPDAFGKDISKQANKVAAEAKAAADAKAAAEAKTPKPDGPDKKPGSPDTPEEPHKPGAPDEPTKPGAPDEPHKPVAPDEPAKPGTPDEPHKPGAPDTPDGANKTPAPAEPAKPGTPDEPHKPAAPDEPHKPAAPDEPHKPAAPDTPEGPHKPGAPEAPTTGAKVFEAVGTIMVISDIGNACETLEKYNSGEISGAEAAETLVDQTLTLGLIGAGKKIDASTRDYWQANKSIYQANKQNVVAYWTQWENQLRKAGVSADEARRMVSSAMASGDASRLLQTANELSSQGKAIKPPTLVIETFEADDTVWQRTKETIGGVVTGVGTGIKYIVTAPSRIVEAWAQGELAEADLELQSATQEAWMRARLFQRLLKAGVSPRDALKAIDDYFTGSDMKKLRDMFRKLRGGYVTSHHSQKDWYCTNRPEIAAPVSLPPILTKGAPVPVPASPVPQPGKDGGKKP